MSHETVRELMEQGFHPNFLEPYIIAAVRAQNIQDLQELLASNRHPLPFVLFDAFEVGNLEIIKLIFESGFVCLRPRDCMALLGVFKEKNDPSEAKQLEIFKYALPHFIENYNLKMDLEIFRLIAKFHDNEKHGMVQYLMEIFYSEEKNKLFPLMKRLEAAIEDSHALLIILHSEIEYFEDSTLYIFTNLVEIFMIFVKLLLKDTPETMQLAIETFRLLLDKRIENIVANFVDITWNFSHDESNSVAFKSPLLQKRLFQMVFHLFGSENDWMIWSLITSCFELFCREFRKYYQFCRFMLPFVIKPTFKWELSRIIEKEGGFEELDRMLSDDSDSLKGICRDVIIAKTAETVLYEPRKLLDGIWALNIPESLKCYLLRIPDPSWMNDLNF